MATGLAGRGGSSDDDGATTALFAFGFFASRVLRFCPLAIIGSPEGVVRSTADAVSVTRAIRASTPVPC